MAKKLPFEDAYSQIICEDCGRLRTVRNQDLHQVKKCAECQKKWRTRRRQELREATKIQK